ncbi:MAG: hypothetical protein AAGJ87_03165 [Pseudomonadota bacterium]
MATQIHNAHMASSNQSIDEQMAELDAFMRDTEDFEAADAAEPPEDDRASALLAALRHARALSRQLQSTSTAPTVGVEARLSKLETSVDQILAILRRNAESPGGDDA